VIGLDAKLGEIRVIFQLTALDEDLLAFRLYTGYRVDLVLEGFAVGGEIEVEVVLFAAMRDND